jgi:hypothetical protein
MNTTSLIKYLFIVFIAVKSPIIGIVCFLYALNNDKRIKNIENQLRVALLEDGEKINSALTDNLEDVSIRGNVDSIEDYKTCIIEVYKNKFCRIMMPSGNFLPKIFLTIEEAKKEIDLVAPMLEPITRKKSRIYNIRYVK